MVRIGILPTLVLFFLPILLVGCDSSAPNPDSIKINILQLQSNEISLSELESAFVDNALLPPLYEQTSDTNLFAIVIPFDIMRLPQDLYYNSVSIMLNSVKDIGTSSYPKNEDVRIVTAIPLSVDRTAEKDITIKLAASFSAALSALTPSVTVEQSTTESYQRLYRTVSAHLTPENEIVWDFVPFKDEPIQPGTYFVVAIVEVRNGTSGNLFFVSAGCSYTVSDALGLSNEDALCSTGKHQRIELIVPQ